MSDSDKQKIINDVYYDKGGFGSKKKTLDDAKKKDPTIKMADVEEFFKKNVELKKKTRGYNSFVAPHNNYSYQVDLFFISKKDLKVKQKFRGGLVMIDVLSKFAVVVPVKRKVTKSVVDGTKKAIEKMGKKPQIIYTDDEKAISSADFREYVEGEGIELYRTRGHPAFAERFIRTFKDMLFKRIENDEKEKKPNIQWIDYIADIMVTYNYKDTHSAINMTPNEAKKDEKTELKARVNVAMKAKKNQIYPEIKVGDKVKIKRKKAITEKEKTSHFLKGEYVVEEITKKLGQTYFKMTDYNRPLMRSDIVKV